MVWDDELTLPEDTVTELINGPLSASASPGPSIQTLPPFLTPQNHRRARSSSSSDFPPPMPLRRTTSDVRPVPFSAKFQRVHPGTTGVTVLEHLERLDAVEAGLERLGMRDGMEDEMDEEEQDVGDLASSSSKSQAKPDVPVIVTDNASLASRPEASGSLSASALSRGSELPSVREAETEMAEEDEEAVTEADVDSPVDEAGMAAMSKSMSYIDMDGTIPKRGHGHRFTTHGSEHGPRRSLDWMQEEPTKKKTVVAEASFLCSWSVFLCNAKLNCVTRILTASGDDGEETIIFSVWFLRCLGMGMDTYFLDIYYYSYCRAQLRYFPVSRSVAYFVASRRALIQEREESIRLASSTHQSTPSYFCC